MNDRERAVDILLRVAADGAFASPLIEGLRVDDRERRFIRTLVFAVLRWRSLLDAWIERLAKRGVNKFDRVTLEILRVGLAQLLFTDVPPHAAVNEMVQLAQRRAARSKGLVNAVLRAAARGPSPAIGNSDTDIEASAPGIASATSHPEWLIARWIETFGAERTRKIALANQRHSYPDLLVNTRLTTADEVLKGLHARSVKASRGKFLPFFVALEGGTSDAADLLASGSAYAMDEGSGVVASLIAEDADQVLDIASAPGGKTLVMAMGKKRVVAHDLSLARVQTLRRSVFLRDSDDVRIVVGNGVRAAFRRRFDAVLLDAPCSATGTIRRNPEVKWRLQKETIEELSRLQSQLLTEALLLTESECIYSTCSIEREENDEVVASVMASNSEFELVDAVDERWPELKSWMDGCVLRLTPESGCDGFTVHKLRRKSVQH